MNKDFDKSYHIATIGNNDEESIKQAEALLKEKTGKDFYIVVWEKD